MRMIVSARPYLTFALRLPLNLMMALTLPLMLMLMLIVVLVEQQQLMMTMMLVMTKKVLFSLTLKYAVRFQVMFFSLFVELL